MCLLLCRTAEARITCHVIAERVPAALAPTPLWVLQKSAEGLMGGVSMADKGSAKLVAQMCAC